MTGMPLHREYPAASREILGARYCTVCQVNDDDHHAVLLWSDEPFTEEIVRREMTALGWTVTEVRTTGKVSQPWVARMSGRRADRPETYVACFNDHDYTAMIWICRWPTGDCVIYEDGAGGWTTRYSLAALYFWHDQWEDPRDDMVLLTKRQAVGIAEIAGKRLPTDEETVAALAAYRAAQEAKRRRWDGLYEARAARFAPQVARWRAESARLAADPPAQQKISTWDEGARIGSRTEAVRVRPGEPFPLLRFLVGFFAGGDHRVQCNRIIVETAGGETLELTLGFTLKNRADVRAGAVTPFCPAEADYPTDPDYVAALAVNGKSKGLNGGVFPVSSGRLELEGRPARTLKDPGAMRGLRIALTFPGGEEVVADDGWLISYFSWDKFGRERALFVPFDLHLLKLVRARFILAAQR